MCVCVALSLIYLCDPACVNVCEKLFLINFLALFLVWCFFKVPICLLLIYFIIILWMSACFLRGEKKVLQSSRKGRRGTVRSTGKGSCNQNRFYEKNLFWIKEKEQTQHNFIEQRIIIENRNQESQLFLGHILENNIRSTKRYAARKTSQNIFLVLKANNFLRLWYLESI